MAHLGQMAANRRTNPATTTSYQCASIRSCLAHATGITCPEGQTSSNASNLESLLHAADDAAPFRYADAEPCSLGDFPSLARDFFYAELSRGAASPGRVGWHASERHFRQAEAWPD
jgi:hypothetical protein